METKEENSNPSLIEKSEISQLKTLDINTVREL